MRWTTAGASAGGVFVRPLEAATAVAAGFDGVEIHGANGYLLVGRGQPGRVLEPGGSRRGGHVRPAPSRWLDRL
ncbi:oxidoreductase [Streptomyces avermitilis]